MTLSTFGRGARVWLSFIAATILLLLAAVGCRGMLGDARSSGVQSGGAGAVTPLDVIPVVIHQQGGGLRVYQAEVARTAQEQRRGLMYRRELAPDAGMIFPHDPPRPASFWMANTFIPLDIIFIRADGVIERIVANTEPESLEPIESLGPVAAVLELNAGEAARAGIKVGDRVDYRP